MLSLPILGVVCEPKVANAKKFGNFLNVNGAVRLKLYVGVKFLTFILSLYRTALTRVFRVMPKSSMK